MFSKSHKPTLIPQVKGLQKSINTGGEIIGEKSWRLTNIVKTISIILKSSTNFELVTDVH